MRSDNDAAQSNADSQQSDIDVDGRGFDVEKVYDRGTGWFELSIQTKEPREDTPNHEFSMILQPGGRRNLTDKYIERKLESWSANHPEYTIASAGISEGTVARRIEPTGGFDE